MKINLLMCGNSKIFDGLLLEILSYIKYNKEETDLYLITMDLREINKNFTPISEEQKTFLEKILKRGNDKNKIYLIDMKDVFLKEMENSPNMANFYTPYTMLRLFADYLPNILDKILYLDCDLMFLGKIDDLYNTNIDNYEYGAVKDVLGEYFIGADYQNAGVILFNLKKCRETGLFKKARLLCKTKKMAFLDQDALNHSVIEKYFLPYIYNVQRNMKKGTIIKHFCKTIRWFPFYHTKNIKSWQIDEVHKSLKIFCFDDIYDEYKKLKKEEPNVF